MKYNSKGQTNKSQVRVQVLPPWYYNPLLRHTEQVSDGKGLQRIIEGLRPRLEVSRRE